MALDVGSSSLLGHPQEYIIMKRKTEKNIENLAKEAYDQMDLDNVEEIIRDQLEYQYAGMTSKEFNEVWEQVFGEN